MKANLNLVRVAGINIKVHWTFFLLIAWIVLSEIKKGSNAQYILYNVAFIITVFLCVVLHELGHALMAKRFKVTTKKITLLPIGGIASLEKIPESPKEEFLVAIGGPLVNVLIAIVLYFTIPINEILHQTLTGSLVFMSRLDVQSFFFYLFIVNIGLVLFNLIPAFPMDGGRVLRALLAMKMSRVKATQIASNTGKFFAIIFLLIGLLYNPILIFIALFIFFGAYGENKMIQQLALMKGHQIGEAMITNITTFHPDDDLEKVVDAIIKGTENNFVVVKNSVVSGIIYHKDIMKTEFKTLRSKDELKLFYECIQGTSKSFFPVVDKEKLVGVIDINNLNEYLLIQAKLTQ